MKKQALLCALALTLGSAVAIGAGSLESDPATAAKGGIPGPPPGKGGGGGAPDYGDLIVILRDDYGVPIPSDPVIDETGETVGGLCWQPIAANGSLIPVDQYTCGVEAEFATLTQEVEFGRINEARSPDDVFAAQLEDVVGKLAIADTTSLDPAGRMVASTCSHDVFATSTIDSPLQSLAVYRQLMLTGSIGTALPQEADWLETAARALGTASDKSGGVTVDMVAYLNMIMGLDEEPGTELGKLCVDMREEVQGTIQLVQKCFLDFSGFGYDRAANFGALPAPAYIPGLPETAIDGWFEYLDETAPGIFEIEEGPIFDTVFGTAFSGGNVGAFAQASDDTRAVINFMHEHPVLPDYVTPVPCTASGDIFVDVSISDVSGLQVPKNVIDGSSDREFIVTVANAGPDAATVTLTVTATTPIEGTVMADLGLGFVESPFVFPETEIAAGSSQAFSALISVQIGEKTTINWTAEASTEEADVNPANNAVTAVSNVKVTRGGGGGH